LWTSLEPVVTLMWSTTDVEKSDPGCRLVRPQLDHVDLDADQLDSDVDHF